MLFRIDDIGASTKKYNQHGKKLFKWKNTPIFYFPFSNLWFFKRICPFREWAPYDELTKKEWQEFLKIFKENNIQPIIAVTACWVDDKNNLIPFPEKFPEEAAILKEAFLNNKITIANHGLTHCVVGKHLPEFFSSSRKYHREFWPYLDKNIHEEHILKSQKILENFFEKPIKIFVPPGNVWSKKTYQAMKNTNIKKVISNRYMLDCDSSMDDIEFINDKNDLNFHDRELKLFGVSWLMNKINETKNK